MTTFTLRENKVCLIHEVRVTVLKNDIQYLHFTKTLSTHTQTQLFLMLSVFYSSLGCVLEAASALLTDDHRCLSLIMVDAPGVSLINRQSQLINNWRALLVLSLSQCHTCGVSQSSLFSVSYLGGDTLLSELLHSLRNELYEDAPLQSRNSTLLSWNPHRCAECLSSLSWVSLRCLRMVTKSCKCFQSENRVRNSCIFVFLIKLNPGDGEYQRLVVLSILGSWGRPESLIA